MSRVLQMVQSKIINESGEETKAFIFARWKPTGEVHEDGDEVVQDYESVQLIISDGASFWKNRGKFLLRLYSQRKKKKEKKTHSWDSDNNECLIV